MVLAAQASWTPPFTPEPESYELAANAVLEDGVVNLAQVIEKGAAWRGMSCLGDSLQTSTSV